ncbi:unnamed protein product [Pieris macdunnoughi]|uniref:Uncharacterized protein n=1 Tax=Pieris macdunnoughi TaxID=345717 RepID=A0A821V815_9NEOP|nr:unnamed protein product [Pieris macdunnoughi]
MCHAGLVWATLLVLWAGGQLGQSKQMSETLQRALSAVRGPSPGAKKLLNIPDDGGSQTKLISSIYELLFAFRTYSVDVQHIKGPLCYIRKRGALECKEIQERN